MTAQEIARLRELHAAVAPGKWYLNSHGNAIKRGNETIIGSGSGDDYEAVLACVLEEHDALPSLLDALEQARAERDALAVELAQVRVQANAAWQEEHAARITLEERLKAAEQTAQALQSDLEMERLIAEEISYGDDL